MKRIWWVSAVVILGCKGDAPAPGQGSAVPTVARHTPTAGTIAPIVTKSITFFAPKNVPWWGEMSFACYASAIRLQPGTLPSSAFTQVSPLVAPALAAADIDLDHDVAAIGVFGCGDGFCLYAALNLRHPEKLPAMMSTMLPTAKQTRVTPLHYTVEAPGPKGTRHIHFQAVPLEWPSPLPTDPWSADAARATHVLFVSGLFGDDAPLDPLALATGGLERVRDVEGVATDPSGACIRGHVGKRDFQPGYTLDHARFALVLPQGEADPMLGLVGSKRTLDLEVELALDPAPTAAVVDRWITEARTWMTATMDPVRAQLASTNPSVDALVDIAGLLVTKGFSHTIKGTSLDLSFRTNRISSGDLAGVEAKLAAFATP